MKVLIIDGQGGKMGSTIASHLKSRGQDIEIYAVGTNSIATSEMLKAGADYGATGENPVIVNAADADIIVGPLGIIITNALHGEITAKMALAVGRSRGRKILIPNNRCNTYIAGTQNLSLSDYVKLVCEKVFETAEEIKKNNGGFNHSEEF